jgi:hypothetical protein
MVTALAVSGMVFWKQDARYGLPTPRPSGTPAPPLGSAIAWPEPVARHLSADRPALLHFFNPDCPCSRFNLDHVRGLWSRFGSDLDVVLVVQSERSDLQGYRISGLPVPLILDTDGSLADLAGVYSTPVAVVLDANHTVVYVGNYTAARYCTDPNAEPARIAIERLLGVASDAAAPAVAPIPFGCPLPSDSAEEAP